MGRQQHARAGVRSTPVQHIGVGPVRRRGCHGPGGGLPRMVHSYRRSTPMRWLPRRRRARSASTSLAAANGRSALVGVSCLLTASVCSGGGLASTLQSCLRWSASARDKCTCSRAMQQARARTSANAICRVDNPRLRSSDRVPSLGTGDLGRFPQATQLSTQLIRRAVTPPRAQGLGKSCDGALS